MILFRRQNGTYEWQSIGKINKNNYLYSDKEVETSKFNYEYYLSSINHCDEEVTSLPHKTILLYGSGFETYNEVHLAWNSYNGWKNEVEKYEVWKKNDDEQEFSLVETVGPEQLEYISKSSIKGFRNFYRVVATEKETGHKSFSNTLLIEFEHEIFIPNAFTPN